MPRLAVCIGFALLFGAEPIRAISQPLQTTAAEPGPHADQIDQLRTCREGLVDPGARPDDRRRWAELLLSYNTAESKALIEELLALADRADVQRAVCGVIAQQGARVPDRLDARFVEPLIHLLGAPSSNLRSLAAKALAAFRGPEVPGSLGKLAARAQVPLLKRLAAIDALAPNADRREVVGQLVTLLDADVPEITDRVIGVLEPLTAQAFGTDLRRWRAWWRTKSRLTDQAWLAEQLQVYVSRLRQVEAAFIMHRADAQRTHDTITQRMRDFQRELFRLSGDQQDTRLVEWLRDPLPPVKRAAMAIITARIADEGKKPDGEVLTALLGLLAQGEPAMRRDVLDIVQNLSAPAVVETVLAQLENERDPATRHAVFKALGKLDNPVATPALIREIEAADSSVECVSEAATALGRVASRTKAGEHREAAVSALKTRYQTVPVELVAMRAALLNGMAGLADTRFLSELQSAVDSDEPEILREAIRGIQALQDRSKLARLRTLMNHGDPRVRLEAINAVAHLGREEADLERLLTRLNPTIETNEPAREAAWRGFREFLSHRSVADRLKAAERLRDVPALEILYLEELADAIGAPNSDTTELDAVLDRLGAVLVRQDRPADAVPHLRTLYDLRRSHSVATAPQCGRRLLAATLQSGTDTNLADLVYQLARSAPDDAERDSIVQTILAYFDSEEGLRNAEQARRILSALQTISGELMGDAWEPLLERVAARLSAPIGQPTPTAPPSNP